MDQKNNKPLLIILCVIILGGLAYYLVNMPDNRTTGEKVGDAIDEMSEDMNEAAEELRN